MNDRCSLAVMLNTRGKRFFLDSDTYKFRPKRDRILACMGVKNVTRILPRNSSRNRAPKRCLHKCRVQHFPHDIKASLCVSVCLCVSFFLYLL